MALVIDSNKLQIKDGRILIRANPCSKTIIPDEYIQGKYSMEIKESINFE